MKKVLFIAASIAIVAPQAFAQAKNFEGFSLGVNAESTTSTATTLGTGSDSATGGSLALQGQYLWPVNQQFLLGLGASYSPTSVNTGAVNGINFSSKNRTSVDLIPGYAITPSAMVYGKLSALSGTAAALNATGTESTANLSGIGYGVGMRYLIDKNLFVQGDVSSNRYNDVGNNGLSSTALAIGVGYKF